MASQATLRGLRRDVRKLYILPVWAALGVGMVLYFTGKGTPPAPAPEPKPAATNGEVYTGSIIVVPSEGYQCWKLLLDNRTGRTWEGGYIDCDTVVEAEEKTKTWAMSAERLQQVQAAFRK
jgi:hypothetical protein